MFESRNHQIEYLRIEIHKYIIVEILSFNSILLLNFLQFQFFFIIYIYKSSIVNVF